jgi:hypothetical protein
MPATDDQIVGRQHCYPPGTYPPDTVLAAIWQPVSAIQTPARPRSGKVIGFDPRGYQAANLDPIEGLAHVPAKRIRFADKDMRQHQDLRRFPVTLDYWGDPM